MAVKKADAIVSGRTYLIVNRKSGKALSAESNAENGGVVEQFFLTREDNKLWTAEKADKGTWKLVCKDSGKCLDVINGGEVDGAWVHQWDYVGGETQHWKLEATKDGYYKIINAKSNKCLDVVDISEEDGAAIQIWEDDDGENQQWKMEPWPASSSAA